MFSFETNTPYPDRIQWILNDYLGPFVQEGPLGEFDPRRDLEVYVDGYLTPVRTFAFDVENNRYLLYMDTSINLQGVIQAIHHMPRPFFIDSGVRGLPSFALIAGYSSAGDVGTNPTPTAILRAIPNSVTALYVPLTLIWETTGIVQIRITATGYDSGLIDTGGVGSVFFPEGVSTTTLFTLDAYDVVGHLALTTTAQVTVLVFTFVDTVTEGAYNVVVADGAVTVIPVVVAAGVSEVILIDSVTSSLYQLQVTSGALEFIPVLSGVGVPYLPFTDIETNLPYKLYITNGAFDLISL